MTQQQATERAAVEKFLAMIGGGEITIFTPEEAAVLQRLAKMMLGFEAMGRLAALFKKILTYLGWAVATYLAIKAGLLDWIKTGLAARP